jgi:outer membrane protein
MKKDWIIGSLLGLQFIGLVWMYFHFSQSTPAISTSEVPVASAFQDSSKVRSAVVAYVNGDSINAHFQFIKDKEAQLQNNLKGADAEFQREYAKREKEAQELVQYAQGKQLPDDEARVVEERLAQLEGEIQQIEAKMSGEIAAKKEAMMKELNDRVKKYLEQFSADRNIDFVLNYQEGIPIVLHGNPAFNVTAEVLSGLNQEYQLEKEKK